VQLFERGRSYLGDRRDRLLLVDRISGGQFSAEAEQLHRTVGAETAWRKRRAAQTVVQLQSLPEFRVPEAANRRTRFRARPAPADGR